MAIKANGVTLTDTFNVFTSGAVRTFDMPAAYTDLLTVSVTTVFIGSVQVAGANASTSLELSNTYPVFVVMTQTIVFNSDSDQYAITLGGQPSSPVVPVHVNGVTIFVGMLNGTPYEAVI